MTELRDDEITSDRDRLIGWIDGINEGAWRHYRSDNPTASGTRWPWPWIGESFADLADEEAPDGEEEHRARARRRDPDG